MFSAEVVDEEVVLKYASDSFTLRFAPERHEALDAVGEVGSFDTYPRNGVCHLEWNADQVVFGIGKFGDGNGGELTVTIRNSPAVMKSLIDSLTRWKEFSAQLSR
jgi:hypothetical protein